MTGLRCLAVMLAIVFAVAPGLAQNQQSTPTTAQVAPDEDFHVQLMRATVMVRHDQVAGTGFVLTAADGKCLLVTAGHVFAKTPGNETSLIFRSRDASGDYRKQPLQLVIRKDGKPLWTAHPTEDVAVMRIVPPAHVDLSRLSPDLLATDALLTRHRIQPGEQLFCLGYPHRNESSEAGFAILRDGPIGSFPLLPTAKTKTFYLSANTFEGDSGGPVCLSRAGGAGGERTPVQLIVGLITGQRVLEEEAKMIYGTTKQRHRLGLAVVVHASFIRATIERLP